MKWQNLYIPDLNNVFVVPCPNASYKLLDRVMVVRSGYPVSRISFDELVFNLLISHFTAPSLVDFDRYKRNSHRSWTNTQLHCRHWNYRQRAVYAGYFNGSSVQSTFARWWIQTPQKIPYSFNKYVDQHLGWQIRIKFILESFILPSCLQNN